MREAVIIQAHGETFAIVPETRDMEAGAEHGAPFTYAEIRTLDRATHGEKLSAATVKALAAIKRMSPHAEIRSALSRAPRGRPV